MGAGRGLLPVIRALLGLVLLAACTAARPAATPHDAAAVFQPDLMVADRETAAPGDVVQLTFPTEMTRGIHFVLEEEVGSGWVYRYGLISNADLGARPSWFVPGDDDVGIPDIGVVGRGPQPVVIPEPATPGSWRICTGNAVENVCVPIEITES